jgi:hypothetical protein
VHKPPASVGNPRSGEGNSQASHGQREGWAHCEMQIELCQRLRRPAEGNQGSLITLVEG